MKPTRRVALFGRDLVISSFGTILQAREELEIIHVDPLSPEDRLRLEIDPPHAILFDLAATRADFAVDVLRKHPGLLLVGVDLGRDLMLVMSAKASRMLTIDDLLDVIGGG